jgi:hypothetical protein
VARDIQLRGNLAKAGLLKDKQKAKDKRYYSYNLPWHFYYWEKRFISRFVSKVYSIARLIQYFFKGFKKTLPWVAIFSEKRRQRSPKAQFTHSGWLVLSCLNWLKNNRRECLNC